eukprot:c22122_g1_i1 orf=88-600(+)
MASPSGNDKTSGKVADSRNLSTSSTTGASAPGSTVQPIWYRFRAAIATLFVVNVAVFGYALLRNKSTPKVSEDEHLLEPAAIEIKNDKQEVHNRKVDAEMASHESSKRESIGATVDNQLLFTEKQQRELFKWMLAELRNAKPSDASEKANIDKQKEVLKQFIRRKELPTF